MMSKLSSPQLARCNPVPAASLWNRRKYSNAWQEASSHVDVCIFWWTWWQPWQMIEASPWVLLRNTSNEGIQCSDATWIHFSSSSETINATKDKSSLLGKIGGRIKVTTTSKPMKYKSSLHLFLATADCYDLLMDSISISVLNSVFCFPSLGTEVSDWLKYEKIYKSCYI